MNHIRKCFDRRTQSVAHYPILVFLFFSPIFVLSVEDDWTHLKSQTLDEFVGNGWTASGKSIRKNIPSEFNAFLQPLDDGTEVQVWIEDNDLSTAETRTYTFADLSSELEKYCLTSEANIKIKYFAENAMAYVFPCGEDSTSHCYLDPPNSVEWIEKSYKLQIVPGSISEVKIEMFLIGGGYIVFDEVTISHNGEEAGDDGCTTTTTDFSTTEDEATTEVGSTDGPTETADTEATDGDTFEPIETTVTTPMTTTPTTTTTPRSSTDNGEEEQEETEEPTTTTEDPTTTTEDPTTTTEDPTTTTEDPTTTTEDPTTTTEDPTTTTEDPTTPTEDPTTTTEDPTTTTEDPTTTTEDPTTPTEDPTTPTEDPTTTTEDPTTTSEELTTTTEDPTTTTEDPTTTTEVPTTNTEYPTMTTEDPTTTTGIIPPPPPISTTPSSDDKGGLTLLQILLFIVLPTTFLLLLFVGTVYYFGCRKHRLHPSRGFRTIEDNVSIKSDPMPSSKPIINIERADGGQDPYYSFLQSRFHSPLPNNISSPPGSAFAPVPNSGNNQFIMKPSPTFNRSGAFILPPPKTPKSVQLIIPEDMQQRQIGDGIRSNRSSFSSSSRYPLYTGEYTGGELPRMRRKLD